MNISDRELLARTLQAEAGNQGYGGMMAAGSVIMNRANTSGFGNGLRGVILKPGQFSAWNSRVKPDGKFIHAGGAQGQDMANMRASGEAYKAADALISGVYDDVTGGATHYYNPAISQPDWGQKAGDDDWKRIGDHVFGFADAGRKPNPNQAIASDTMRVLGKQPKGLLTAPQTTNDTESNMTPEQAPKGLLGSLGIQKMVEGAEGDAGQRFYNRQSFGDTMAALAPALGRMGVMGLDVPAQAVADRRFAERDREQKASKTIEALSRMNTPQAKQALEYLSAGGDPVAALQMAFGKSEGKVRQVTGASMGMTGPNADKLYNLSADGKLTPIGGSAPVTNIYPGSKGTGKFEELDASTLSDASSAAMAASRSLSQIDRLGDLLSNVDTGAAASLQSLAGSFGIKTEGLSDIQAAEALISALVPQQRQAGSGPMSDEDLKLFKKSLPQLMNTPEGNRIILQTLRGLAEYDVLGGQIVQQYRRNPEEFTQADAFDALLARPDPFAQFRIAVPQPNAQPNVTPSGSQTTSTGITFQIKR